MNELRPKRFDVIKGYTKEQLMKDIISGIIVAIIALPLSIALAIASGVGPEQGLGNIFSGLFGGIPATGAIARTAANVRNGGRTPIAGITHCITLTIILLVLMPLAALIPMTTLAAVLLVVAANMADWSSFFRLCKMAPKSDIIVLVATFFLTVFFDLVVAIEIGVVLAALLFMKRMAETADIKAWKYTDSPDITPGEAEKLRDIPHSISVFEICGPMFFAAADQILNINSNHHTKVVVIRMRSVPAIDASAMRSLHELANRAKRKISRWYSPMSMSSQCA